MNGVLVCFQYLSDITIRSLHPSYAGHTRPPAVPLQEIPIWKVRTGKRRVTKTPRRLHPKLEPSAVDVPALAEQLQSAAPGLIWLQYQPSLQGAGGIVDNVTAGEEQNSIDEFVPAVPDCADLHSTESREIFKAHVAHLQAMDADEREQIRLNTVGQAENREWFLERTGRITTSMFKQAINCRKTRSILKDIFRYRTEKPLRETDPRFYGIKMEPVAIAKYTELRALADSPVTVLRTGLHVHKDYPFLAGSPDGIVQEATGEGLLEVKCPSKQAGRTPEEACTDKEFCCELVGSEVKLKKKHAYYFQVQGLLGVTGLKWCDFVVFTNHPTPGCDISIERIAFDEEFWSGMLPGLLYFYEKAVVPELLTKRVKRLGELHTTGVGHIPFRLFKQGFHTCDLKSDGLKMVICKAT